MFGSILSAVFVQLADYRRIFFCTTVLAVPSALLCIPLIPTQIGTDGAAETGGARPPSNLEKIRRLDLGGVRILTGLLALRSLGALR